MPARLWTWWLVGADHWGRLATFWSLLGSPLRPAAQDMAVAEAVARSWRQSHPGAPLHALVLGATPEYAAMAWPDGASVVAIDRSEAMLGALWPGGEGPPARRGQAGDWRALALADGSVDLALGDGCFTVVEFPDEARQVTRELGRVLRPGGRLVVRVFARPEAREELDEVAAALWAGRIGSLHALKWRLAMAVQPARARRVAVVDVWHAFVRICPDASRLVTQLGWPPQVLATIEPYRESAAAYAFPTLEEMRAVLADGFIELACHVPGYELGDRCPTLVLEPRARP
jgi:SAM-dependent methyltransferase